MSHDFRLLGQKHLFMGSKVGIFPVAQSQALAKLQGGRFLGNAATPQKPTSGPRITSGLLELASIEAKDEITVY
jgi:hypothetical protein